MRYLSVLRHAKAERLEGYPNDKARPLTSRGVKDTSLMARLLARLDPAPTWIISSPAQRAQQTAEGVSAALPHDHQVILDERVYDASVETLLSVLGEVPPEVDHAVIVGHNPSMVALVSGLCTGSTERLNLMMVTGALAYLELEIVWWNQIRWGCGGLHMLMKPKLLRE